MTTLFTTIDRTLAALANDGPTGTLTLLAARLLTVPLFLLAGLGKLGDPAGTMGYMAAMGVPTLLYWPTVALEILTPLALLVGFQTRLAALALAGFSLLSAAIFHTKFGDQIQMIMFLKNLAIAGGLLWLVRAGAGPLSIDAKLAEK